MTEQRLSSGARKLLLAVHLAASVGWVGAAAGYLALAFAVPLEKDPTTTRAAWIGMELIGWYVIVPLAVAALLTGTLLALGTHWGLLRHYWVLISFVTTVVLTVVLLLHMPDVSHVAGIARDARADALADLGSDIPHALVGLVLLLGVLVLNILKPRGLTPYGWRRRQAERRRAR